MNSKITIIAYGIAKDLIGQREFFWPLQESCTAEELKKRILKAHPQFQELNGFNLAIGDEYAQDNDTIKPGDMISILPPVSGG